MTLNSVRWFGLSRCKRGWKVSLYTLYNKSIIEKLDLDNNIQKEKHFCSKFLEAVWFGCSHIFNPDSLWERDGDLDCGCGTIDDIHEINVNPKCEYYKHHCEECHKINRCTLESCKNELHPFDLNK